MSNDISSSESEQLVKKEIFSLQNELKGVQETINRHDIIISKYMIEIIGNKEKIEKLLKRNNQLEKWSQSLGEIVKEKTNKINRLKRTLDIKKKTSELLSKSSKQAEDESSDLTKIDENNNLQ